MIGDVIVEVNEPLLQDKTVLPSNEKQTVLADDGYNGLSSVTVEAAGTSTIQSLFNIEYGDNEPADTSKLWVKCNRPDMVQVTSDIVIGNEELDIGLASLPTAVDGIAAAAIGTKIYLFGGRWYGGGSDDTINVFDIETNTITTLDTKLPTGAYAIASAIVGTKVYLFGGTYGSSLYTINVFDTENHTITTLDAALPNGAGSIASAVVGSRVYLFGGSYVGTPLNTINVFDTETNSITTLDVTLPIVAYGIASATIGTKVYLFGGRTGTNTYVNVINIFDTETNTITTLDTKLPTAAQGIASAVIGTKVYLFGGYISNYLNTINVFDTETNTITTLDTKLPNAAYNIASAIFGTKIYLFGGYSSVSNNPYLDTINVFNVSLNLSTNTLLIETDIAKNLVNILPSIEIGIKNVYIGNSEGYAEKVPAYLYKDGAWVEI